MARAGSAGSRRIDDPEDALRAEINTALRLRLRIIPLLVAGAAVPQEDELPPDLAPLVDWQALRIDDDDFDHDSARLIKALERQLQDEGPDPHLDSTDAKSSEIRRLLESAESSIAREDWITAAQTLRAVLSLDRTHEEATDRLRFVQQQTTRAFAAVPLPPVPRKRRAERWMALGVLGFLGVLLSVLMVSVGKEPTDARPDGGGLSPVEEVSTVTPSDFTDPEPAPVPTEPRPSSEAAPEPRLAGEYELISYAVQGAAIPFTGSMRLVPVRDGQFRFEMSVTHASLGAFHYSGRFEGQGASWTMTTVETNDPTAYKQPIPTQVRWDGSTLVLQSLYASASWRKQPGSPR